jgi:hypothetical protein
MIDLPLLKLGIRHALDEGDTTEDAYLELLEAAAADKLEDALGYGFPSPAAEVARILDGPGADALWLPEEPAADPALVLETRSSGGEWEEVDASDYELDGRVLYRLSGRWTLGRRNYRATYTTGYASGEEPAWARNAVVQIVAHWYENREPVAVGTVAADIPMHVMETLLQKRRIPV